jgi:hypothetical protein
MAVLEWEELLVSLTHELPQPVAQETGLDGVTVLVGGDPGEVVVHVTRSSVTVSEFAIEGDGPHHPVTRTILFGRIQWRRLDGVRALEILRALIFEARQSRHGKYRTCRYCEAVKPPESMHDEDVCQACAEEHLGIVY